MECPNCGASSRVISTARVGDVIRRRRECANSHRFNTQEGHIADDIDETETASETLARVIRILAARQSTIGD